MSSALESKENEFALKVVRALEENTSHIPAAAVNRLAQARRTAIARKKPEKVAVAVSAPCLHAGARRRGQHARHGRRRGRASREKPARAARRTGPRLAARGADHRDRGHRLLGRPAAQGGARRHRPRHDERQPAHRCLSRSRLQRVSDAQPPPLSTEYSGEFSGELQARSRACLWLRDCGSRRVRRDLPALLLPGGRHASRRGRAERRLRSGHRCQRLATVRTVFRKPAVLESSDRGAAHRARPFAT